MCVKESAIEQKLIAKLGYLKCALHKDIRKVFDDLLALYPSNRASPLGPGAVAADPAVRAYRPEVFCDQAAPQ